MLVLICIKVQEPVKRKPRLIKHKMIILYHILQEINITAFYS